MVSPVKTLVPYTIIRFASGRASGCKITLQLPYDSQMSVVMSLNTWEKKNKDRIKKSPADSLSVFIFFILDSTLYPFLLLLNDSNFIKWLALKAFILNE